MMRRALNLTALLAMSLLLTSGSCSKEPQKAGSTWDQLNLGGKTDTGTTDDSMPATVYTAAGCTDLMKQKARAWRDEPAPREIGRAHV